MTPARYTTLVIGVDPGPIPGICCYYVIEHELGCADAAQVTPGLISPLIRQLVAEAAGIDVHRTVLCCEEFVVRGRSGRSATPEAGNRTRRMIGELEALARRLGLEFHTHTASDVKQWATDRRLRAAGLYQPTEGMRHARDGARHALFGGVKHAGVTDPLSIRARS